MNYKYIEGDSFIDERGKLSFVNNFKLKNVNRFYQVENHKKNYVRAWHGHKYEEKYVFVNNGTFKIGIVEIEESDFSLIPEDLSKKYSPKIFIMSSEKPAILHIPRLTFNGFMNLTDNGIITFFSTKDLKNSVDDDFILKFDVWNIWDQKYF